MNNHGLILRQALPSDLSILEYWDQQKHVIDADPDDDWEWEKELAFNPTWRSQLMAELNGEPIGFIQIIDPFEEETHYWGDVAPDLRAIDIWIGEEKNLGKGYGTQMMQLAIEKCFSDPKVTKILIDPLASNTKAHRFYERLGFEFVEERKFDEDDCFVYALKR
ncbi:MAG: GNAT family N-acetyltransferase [Cytophagales bacterium CG12_big_fil_rev_8_21_14_0_65_40_12]|nr:MAG: GNAT family N-acetyltransferase [Cytophagales bacterium CG12_big_fil_rev_8_21_14_0_65_40_12]PIW04434.1 MAG: GNAT family N-acetyltransferase [Cytophagales bacterium CG17_big_fil_post_rev_8_21_14_2_50_40_13]